MSELNVGKLEELLRPYSKETIIHTGCRKCHSGSSGGNILKIIDNSRQTYGYIELEVNENSEPSKEVLESADKEFFINEIDKLKETIKAKDNELRLYKDLVSGVVDTIESRIKWIERMEK